MKKLDILVISFHSESPLTYCLFQIFHRNNKRKQKNIFLISILFQTCLCGESFFEPYEDYTLTVKLLSTRIMNWKNSLLKATRNFKLLKLFSWEFIQFCITCINDNEIFMLIVSIMIYIEEFNKVQRNEKIPIISVS